MQRTFTFSARILQCAQPRPESTFVSPPAVPLSTRRCRWTANSTVTGTIARTELWVDGVKKYAVASAVLNTSISLAAGTHRFAVLAFNTAGQKWEAAVNATVGTAGGGGACSAPASPGVSSVLPPAVPRLARPCR